MNKKDFENIAKEKGLRKVKRHDEEVEGKAKYFWDDERQDIYGFYKKDKQYVAFYKSLERSIFKILGKTDTEDEVYDLLVKEIKNENK